MTGSLGPVSFSDARKQLPSLAALEPQALSLIERAGRIAHLPAGSIVFSPGSECSHYIIVLEGSVKVRLVSETGREIALYRVGSGETCVLTTSCLMTGADYDAEAVTETDVMAMLVPRIAFHEALGASETFRRFTFTSFSDRLSELLALVSEVAFGHVDRRLAGWILTHAANGDVAATHQEIAADIGSAREVVSRLLKDFERQGLVSLSRGHVAIANAAGLRQFAAHDRSSVT